jgi:hypothetical protein
MGDPFTFMTRLRVKIPRTDHWSLRPDESEPDKQTLLFDYYSSLLLKNTGFIF